MGEELKYFSMFSGIGGFELGIKRAWESIQKQRQQNLGRKGIMSDNRPINNKTRLRCVGYSEIDKYAIQAYQKHFKDHKNYGDATGIIPKQLPDFDILVGGFPCQSFSIAGKRKGFEESRGTLFFEIARILEVKKPRWVLLENVKGLLSHDNYETIFTIFRILSDLGYTVSWEVLNSKHFNVPQNRERIFIFGARKGSEREIFPIRESNLRDAESQTKEHGERERIRGNIAPALRSRDYKGSGFLIGEKGKEPCVPVLTPDRPEKRQNGRRFKDDGDPAFTLTAQDRHGVFNGERIRRLTPVECERLQGFPDGWTEDLSDTQRYKCLGNAVTVNVIEAIFRSLIKV